jgi:hypothetical protein
MGTSRSNHRRDISNAKGKIFQLDELRQPVTPKEANRYFTENKSTKWYNIIMLTVAGFIIGSVAMVTFLEQTQYNCTHNELITK